MLFDELEEELLLLADSPLAGKEVILFLLDNFFRKEWWSLFTRKLIFIIAYAIFFKGVRIRQAIVGGNMLIIVVVDDVILVLSDDIHRTEHIQRVIDSPLHIFEINFLPNLDTNWSAA